MNQDEYFNCIYNPNSDGGGDSDDVKVRKDTSYESSCGKVRNEQGIYPFQPLEIECINIILNNFIYKIAQRALNNDINEINSKVIELKMIDNIQKINYYNKDGINDRHDHTSPIENELHNETIKSELVIYLNY